MVKYVRVSPQELLISNASIVAIIAERSGRSL